MPDSTKSLPRQYTSIDFSLARSCDIYPRAISQQATKYSV